MAFEIICCVSLQDPIIRHHIMPLAMHPRISRLWIIRPKKIDLGTIPKTEYIVVSTRFKWLRFLLMIWHCLKLGRRKEVTAFVSFNPIPYGLFSFLAAKLYKKPMHFGLIGSDWNRSCKGPWGRWLLPLLRRGNLITTPGQSMRKEMLEAGFPPEKILVLTQSTDLDRFPVVDANPPRYHCIFVGSLLPNKRVDVILTAFEQVLQSHPYARLCIVGDGPLADDLKQLTTELNIHSAVDFVGHVKNVQPFLAASKMIIIASHNEGFPSALVEGMSSGLVPISTPVGSIPNVIQNQRNGLLFPVGNAVQLTLCINRLLDDPGLYKQLRESVIQSRSQFSHENTTAHWDPWLTSIRSASDAQGKRYQ
jgi:glycosyltransferase involved in cell wall biosynthesis